MDVASTKPSLLASAERIREFLAAFDELNREDPIAADCIANLISQYSRVENSPLESVSFATTESSELEPALALWGDTHHETIERLFVNMRNSWLSVSDIRRLTNIGRGAVAQVLYSTHADSFVRKSHPNHASMKHWRLTDEAFSSAQSRLSLQQAKSGFEKGGTAEKIES
ncbi:MAG: hypothetical protein AAGA25_11275 [Planctomycetota bacterium]